MNSLILTNENTEVTDPEILRHLNQTLKVQVGDVLKVTIINRGVGKAKVLSANDLQINLDIIEIKPAKNPEIIPCIKNGPAINQLEAPINR